ncbi:MAG: hypothetical protein ACYDA5_03755 [Vulcanimicrobiaceae bacterium]
MDVQGIATQLASSSVTGQVNSSVLAAVQNLSKNLAAELFASIGLGSSIDRYA